MSEQEAIEILGAYYEPNNRKQNEAMDMAIKALGTDGDLISRQAAIDAMATWDWQELYLPIHFKQLLEELPSVQTEIIRCKDCVWNRVCRFGQYLGLNGYCSKAERREDG